VIRPPISCASSTIKPEVAQAEALNKYYGFWFLILAVWFLWQAAVAGFLVMSWRDHALNSRDA
jgi:hypothetical protein